MALTASPGIVLDQLTVFIPIAVANEFTVNPVLGVAGTAIGPAIFDLLHRIARDIESGLMEDVRHR